MVVRCLFKPRPFKHAIACVDQFTSGLYVEEMAREIALSIKHFNDLPETIHIGGIKKSTFDLAKETRDVNPCFVEDIKSVVLPKDTSLNCQKWNKLKEVWNA